MPAIVELAPAAGLDVLVISDANPTLQALRTELRPDQPEVDGILGTNALRDLELDVDYPHNRAARALHRTDGSAGCVTRPALSESRDRTADPRLPAVRPARHHVLTRASHSSSVVTSASTSAGLPRATILPCSIRTT